MPPKKKEQEIDISTLPQCLSLNTHLYAKGKSSRLTRLAQIIRPITRQQIIDHAKEKSLYTDPSQLTDKQKKDPKLLQTICTQITPDLLARATQSLLTTHNTKIRMTKKGNTLPYDVIYNFTDYPTSKDQYLLLHQTGIIITYILVIHPKVTLPEEDQQEYENTVKRETLSPEEVQKDRSIDQQIERIKRTRSMAMALRNITLVNVQYEVDVMSEENTQGECVKAFWEHIERLNAEAAEYEGWKRDKVAKPIHPAQHTHISLTPTTPTTPTTPISTLLKKMVQQMYTPHLETPLTREQLLSIMHTKSTTEQHTKQQSETEEWHYHNAQTPAPQIKIVGIDRHNLPPPTPYEQRRSQCAEYIPFLNKMSVAQFQRSKILLNFQQLLSDEDTKYLFNDRTYEEQHDADSLRRQLQLLWTDIPTTHRYVEEQNAVYITVAQKPNQRRMAKHVSAMPWRVLPNLENWVQYFKTNESNLLNNQYYDLDYQLVAPIVQSAQSFSVCGGLIIKKEYRVGEHVQQALYGVWHGHVFGVNRHGVYSECSGKRIRYYQEQQVYVTVIELPQHKITVQSNGVVYTQYKDSIRAVTPDGYSILYNTRDHLILHPNGAVSVSPDTYTNQHGYGLSKGKLSRVHTLKRRTEAYTLLKRDDGVTKVEFRDRVWILFNDGSQYLIQKDEIRIEKPNHPYIVCKGNEITISVPSVTVTVQGNSHKIEYSDGHTLDIEGDTVKVSCGGEQYFLIDRVRESITGHEAKDRVQVGKNNPMYYKGDIALDPCKEIPPQEQHTALQHPRLFYIKDNKGRELLNESQLHHYFTKKHIRYDKQNRIHFIQHLNTPKTKHILIGNITQDVFTHIQSPPLQPPSSHSIRILTQHQDSGPTSAITKIKGEAEQWRKWVMKEENEYGYKPDQQSVDQRIRHKLVSLSYRMSREEQTQQYMSEGISLHQEHTRRDMAKKNKEREEMRMRESYSKAKQTYKQEYKWKPLQQPPFQTKEQEEIPPFYPHYFYTIQGKRALESMPQWVFRPKAQPLNENQQQMLQELNNTVKSTQPKKQTEEQVEEEEEDKMQPLPLVLIKPSVFTKKEIDEERSAFESEQQAYKYHEMKRKDYNVYGKERKEQVMVRSLFRTEPPCEINQKHIITDAAYDKRVKISSMKNKLTSQATSINQLRRGGQHAALTPLGDTSVYLNKRLLMAKAVLTDKLQRDILIIPAKADFGTLLPNRTYVTTIDIKNQDVIPQRIVLKRPKTIHAKVEISQTGPIAMGITRKVIVTLKTTEIGKFIDQFDIVTKHEIYHIPIMAVVGEEERELKSGVREEEIRKKDTLLPPIK